MRAWLPALGLLLAPALTVLSAPALRGLALGEGAAASLHYGAGTATALASLAIAARATLTDRATAAMAALGAALVVGAALAHPSALATAALVNLGLVAAAHAVGSWVGRRVGHPGHLLPACAVAAAADVASVVHPSGPSHAIASSDRALSLVAVAFPVPGAPAVAPVLGVGDLVFVALIFGAAVAHRIALVRTTVAAAVGIALAGAAAALLGREVPALVTIGAAVVAGIPEARRLRPEDRRASTLAIAVAAAVVLGVLATAHQGAG